MENEIYKNNVIKYLEATKSAVMQKEPEPEPLEKIKIRCVYVNGSNEIVEMETIDQILDQVDVNHSQLSDLKLMNLIEKRKIRKNKKYKMTDIVTYTIDLDRGNWMHFDEKTNGHLKNYTIPQTINIPSTFSVFHRLNMIWIFFRELILINSPKKIEGDLSLKSILKKQGVISSQTKKKVRLIEPTENNKTRVIR